MTQTMEFVEVERSKPGVKFYYDKLSSSCLLNLVTIMVIAWLF